MPPPSKSIRFEKFIAQLRTADPVSNRDEALALMMQVMNSVEDHYKLPKGDYIVRMHVFPFHLGWQELGSNPCYWDDHPPSKHRVLLYDDGRIVIRQIHEPEHILLDKSGRSSG